MNPRRATLTLVSHVLSLYSGIYGLIWKSRHARRGEWRGTFEASDNKAAVEPSYLGLEGGKGAAWEIPYCWRAALEGEDVRQLLTSLLSATMISSTYLVVAWTWRLCCKEQAKRGRAREQEDRMGRGRTERGE